MLKPEDLDAWYETTRGRCIGQQEFSSVMKLITPTAGQTSLDIGSETDYFSHNFRQNGLNVIVLDTDKAMNYYAVFLAIALEKNNQDLICTQHYHC